MFESFVKILKTIIFVVITGAVIVVTFYLSYVLLFLAVLILLFCLGSLYNNRNKITEWFTEDD
jgi:hypothetical protein